MLSAERISKPDDRVISDFINTGAHLFPEALDGEAAADLLAKIRSLRHFDGDLFLSESAFDADPLYVGVNPRPGRNLLERFEADLGFVEQNPRIVAGLSALLGPDYAILNKKVVCGVPARSVPPRPRPGFHSCSE